MGAAAERIPEELVRQLKVGGRMVIPVGPASESQALVQVRMLPVDANLGLLVGGEDNACGYTISPTGGFGFGLMRHLIVSLKFAASRKEGKTRKKNALPADRGSEFAVDARCAFARATAGKNCRGVLHLHNFVVRSR